jgi:hypothetical protein
MKLHPLALVYLLTVLLCPHSSPAATFATNTLIEAGNISYDDQDIVIINCTVTVNGSHGFNSLRLTNNAVLTHSPAASGQSDRRLHLTIMQGVAVDGSSRIDTTGRGYAGSTGPGAGTSSATKGGAGAGHGGLGGFGTDGGSVGGVYDSVLTPAQPGSGGGNGYSSLGGSGGGVVEMVIGGTLRLDGLLSVNGGDGLANGYGGGGSGGSIAITAGTLAGFGVISADGGVATASNGGGGGGGRVTLQMTVNQFAGTVTAYGGAGQQFGGAGTVLTKVGAGASGDVRVDNGGNPGQLTPITSPQPFGLTIANRAIVYPLTELTNASITLKSNGLLTQLDGQPSLTLTVLSNLIIETGGRLDVTGKGYAAGSGPGAGGASATAGGGGGGHGGNGGIATGAGGAAFGSITAPAQPGSGGGTGYASTAGAGGGVIRLSVAGTLQVDGTLAANGADSYNYINGGGGAGGSLWLTVGALRGSGRITADGGASEGEGGGGGAGGRIAIYHATSLFTGVLSAYGGAGLQRGGAGTIFTHAASATHGAVLVHNAGLAGGLTRLNPAFWPAGNFFDLTVAGAAQVNPEVPMTFWTLALSSGAVLSHDQGQGGFHLTTLGDARLDPGTAINVNALGSSSASGPGAGGSSASKGGGGGGYGGAGGAWTNTAAAGVTNGSVEEPISLGSGGGAGYLSRGGFGGGALRLSVGGLLELNGSLTANGGPGLDYNYGGGGAGGSIYVTADILTGAGTITANGGSSPLAGGGGGGRVALYPRLLVGFTNVPAVLAGGGGITNLNGRPGTVYYASNVAPLRVTSVLPSGAVMRPVTGVGVIFSAAVNATTFTPADVVVTTPSGIIPSGQIVVTPLAGPLFNVSFPLQTNLGTYRVKIGPHLQDSAGREMDQNGNRIPGEDAGDAFTNTFTLTRPVISGTITAANGWPVRGATVRASDNSATTLTDTNGLYSLTLAPAWTGSIVPSLIGATFAPTSRTYTGLDAHQANQNFTLANALNPSLSLTLIGTNTQVSWPSLPSYKYQFKASENLRVWQNLGGVTNGTGGSLFRVVPITPGQPTRFFRVQVLLD